MKWIKSDDDQIDFKESLRNVKTTTLDEEMIIKEKRKLDKEDAADTEASAYGEVSIGVAKAGGSVKKKL